VNLISDVKSSRSLRQRQYAKEIRWNSCWDEELHIQLFHGLQTVEAHSCIAYEMIQPTRKQLGCLLRSSANTRDIRNVHVKSSELVVLVLRLEFLEAGGFGSAPSSGDNGVLGGLELLCPT
jgi:hypothetical protein